MLFYLVFQKDQHWRRPQRGRAGGSAWRRGLLLNVLQETLDVFNQTEHLHRVNIHHNALRLLLTWLSHSAVGFPGTECDYHPCPSYCNYLTTANCDLRPKEACQFSSKWMCWGNVRTCLSAGRPLWWIPVSVRRQYCMCPLCSYACHHQNLPSNIFHHHCNIAHAVDVWSMLSVARILRPTSSWRCLHRPVWRNESPPSRDDHTGRAVTYTMLNTFQSVIILHEKSCHASSPTHVCPMTLAL